MLSRFRCSRQVFSSVQRGFNTSGRRGAGVRWYRTISRDVVTGGVRNVPINGRLWLNKYGSNIVSSVSLTRPLSSNNLPPHVEVTLPAFSPTMEQGTIVKWEKEVGDRLEEGDIIALVETDKATMDMETPSEGYLAKIIVPAGSKDLPLFTKLAVIVENEGDISAFDNYTPQTAPAASAETTPTPVSSDLGVTTGGESQGPSPSVAATNYPSHIKVTLPALSPTMEQGTIVKWEKEVGDRLEEGDIIALVETDKATMDMETPSEGYLAKIIVPAGSKDLPLFTLLAVIAENESDVPSFKDYVDTPTTTPSPAAPSPKPLPSQPSQAPPTQSPPTPPVVTPHPPLSTGPVGRIIASPYAKKLALEKNINLQTIQGTGASGRIVAKDVLGATPSATPTMVSSTTPTSSYEDIQLSGMRKTIAARLMQSKQTIPHYYLSIDVNMDDVLRLREGINSTGDIKLSVNDFIVKASGLALLEVPQVNSSWMDTFIRQYNSADVCVAVSTEGGLITPIIAGVENKGLKVISSEMRELAEKARAGRLQPHEFQGGTFTISNLGMYGIRNFSAVINPPQSCILAVGATEKRVIVDEDKSYKVAPVMSVTMSCDHRVVDGAVGAQWLAVFKSYLEKPFKMLL